MCKFFWTSQVNVLCPSSHNQSKTTASRFCPMTLLCLSIHVDSKVPVEQLKISIRGKRHGNELNNSSKVICHLLGEWFTSVTNGCWGHFWKRKYFLRKKCFKDVSTSNRSIRSWNWYFNLIENSLIFKIAILKQPANDHLKLRNKSSIITKIIRAPSILTHIAI